MLENIESTLIAKSLAGDESAQYKLYNSYAKAMLNVAYRIVKNEEDARDILQDSFVKAFQNLDRLENRNGFGAWMKRIVINTSLTKVNKKGLDLVSWNEKEIQNYSEIDIEYNDLDINDIKKALLELPIGYRTVLTLYLIEGYDHEEISNILNISKSTSLTQYSRGKKKLKHILQQNK